MQGTGSVVGSDEGEHGKTMIAAGQEKDLPVGDYTVVEAGGREILIVHLDSGFYALANSCIHGGCRIGYGKFEGTTLRCLCHGSVFDIRTGEVLSGPATEPQPSYTVIVKNGRINLVL